jgi:hypothetical protein
VHQRSQAAARRTATGEMGTPKPWSKAHVFRRAHTAHLSRGGRHRAAGDYAHGRSAWSPPACPENIPLVIVVCARYPTVFVEKKTVDVCGASTLRSVVSGATVIGTLPMGVMAAHTLVGSS